MIEKLEVERESMLVDVVIVGAGPAGLSAACRLMQCAQEQNKELSVIVLEKGAEVGAHILSGAILETRALDELFPNWHEDGAPVTTAVSHDKVYLLRDQKRAFSIPHWLMPKSMYNNGNYIISLGDLCRWLEQQAQKLGVDIYPGFTVNEVLYHQDGSIKGVASGAMGRDRNGNKKASFEPGMELHASVTLFAEGCRGQLGKQLIQKFSLDAESATQHYALGIKELWQIDDDKHQPGLVIHGTGWPLHEHGANGGFFLYHFGDNLIATGLITDLNYANPHLSPYDEFQRFKYHDQIHPFLAGGERIAYGARAITKGGLNSLPRMEMPGGLLIGCDAGTLNFAKIKGTHTAMKSGMLAAEATFNAIQNGLDQLTQHQDLFKASWLYTDLYKSQNFGASMHRFGFWFGACWNFIEQNIFMGKLPLTLSDKIADHATLKPASQYKVIEYPGYDNKLSFDKTSSVYLAGTNHEEDQPCHLVLSDKKQPLAVNWPDYGGPEVRFCPAGVYEYIIQDDGVDFHINAQNCLHCKTCDIKDLTQNITWVAPEGGGGPNYTKM